MSLQYKSKFFHFLKLLLWPVSHLASSIYSIIILYTECNATTAMTLSCQSYLDKYMYLTHFLNSQFDWWTNDPLQYSLFWCGPASCERELSGPSVPELIPVSVAWSDMEYHYSTLDGMLIHCRVTPSIKFAVTLLYTIMVRERHWDSSVLPKNTTQCSPSGLRPRLLDSESSTLRSPWGHHASH